jgi:ssDNA-binding Zn-finger/Zn-ribbon topoisomerase 1
MHERTITCPNCGSQFELKRHRKARWLAAGAGALLGAAATRSLLGGALIGTISYGIATMFDEYQAHRCPECQMLVTSMTQRQARPEQARPEQAKVAEKEAKEVRPGRATT